jgi:hypothetical protein
MLARHQLKRNVARWPVFPPAGTPPPGWPGWPGGKQFALVLTHDVEGPRGLANCEQLMELEMELGFRSSFNFIPEANYKVPQSLRERLESEGFEVGVHDLHHNGKLYRSKERFDAAASRINHYLREWNAVGFRSGFMHRNLDWLHALEIEYDMSTFDTDPFEPQPDGVHTIFPFWVSKAASDRARGGTGAAAEGGYVELPYTLAQDSTLFLLLREKGIATWKLKLEWVAQAGGMALLNVHPDYISFGDGFRTHTFPSGYYREFLMHVREIYHGAVGMMLPREAATYAKSARANNASMAAYEFSRSHE